MWFRGNVLYPLTISGAKLRPSVAAAAGTMGWVGFWVEVRQPSCTSALTVSPVARRLTRAHWEQGGLGQGDTTECR